MKTTLIAATLIALCVAASGNALAQRDDRGSNRGDRGDHGQQQNNDRNDHNDRGDHNARDNRDNHDNGMRGNGENRARNYDARNFRRDDSRGGGPRHDLRRGQRLNQEYRNNRYVVSDWKARRLAAPPRGQHWVQAGDDYVLAAIATGIITQILLAN